MTAIANYPTKLDTYIPQNHSEKFPNHLNYKDFKTRFQLGGASTEKDNPATVNLSDILIEDRKMGLEMLLGEEIKVMEGFKQFVPQLDSLAPTLAQKVKQGGRIIFVGLGSSGRAGLATANNATTLCKDLKPEITVWDGQTRILPKCFGVIGGGDGAAIKAREGFEDSPDHGQLAARKLKLAENDTIFMISASGSATFLEGFGHEAANQKSSVYFFYNSTEVPERTSNLFKRQNNPVIPLLLDIGPQAILGSTRLQGYSIAHVCLSYLMGQVIKRYDPTIDCSGLSAECIVEKLTQAQKSLYEILDPILEIIQQEYQVFSSPEANLRRERDQTDQGYVTFLGTLMAIIQIVMDTVETSPTFFLNPCRREGERNLRRSEYQAFLAGVPDNSLAWKILLGRDPLFEEDELDVGQFILSADISGHESYKNRPKGKGNCVIGVEVLHKGETLSEELIKKLKEAKEAGATTALIVISEDPQTGLKERLQSICDTISLIDHIQDDPLGITFGQLLKWECNLISNGAMILLGKVLGNQMIDLRTSNNKLIDRCMRLIHKIWAHYHPNEMLDDENLYYQILTIYEQQKIYQARGEYTPSTLKIVLTMLETGYSFTETMDYLRTIEEKLHLLFVKPQH